MDGIMIAAIIVAVFIFGIVAFIACKSIMNMKNSRENKALFLSNSKKIKKGQPLNEVLDLLGRPTSYSEIDDNYVLTWEQTEETGFNSIVRSLTIILNQEQKIIDVHRKNMN